MDIKIRKLKKTELPEINKLIAKVFPKANTEIKQGDNILIADNHGEIIGFSHVRPLQTKLLLKGIGVERKYRGLGVGKKLLGETLKVLAKTDLPVYLKVKNSNDIAIHLYSKEGFVSRKYGDVLVMVRLPAN